MMQAGSQGHLRHHHSSGRFQVKPKQVVSLSLLNKVVDSSAQGLTVVADNESNEDAETLVATSSTVASQVEDTANAESRDVGILNLEM